MAADPSLFTGLLGAALGAGGLQAITAFRKSGVEKENIVAGTQHQVSETVIAINEELRTELARRDLENATLRSELTRLRTKFVELQNDFNALEREVTAQVKRRNGG